MDLLSLLDMLFIQGPEALSWHRPKVNLIVQYQVRFVNKGQKGKKMLKFVLIQEWNMHLNMYPDLPLGKDASS